MEIAEKNTKTVNINKLHMVEKIKENMPQMRREMKKLYIYNCISRDIKYHISKEKKDMELNQQKIRHWKTKYQ